MSNPAGDLTAYWSKSKNDILFDSTDGPHAVDGRRVVYHAFSVILLPDGKSFLDELEARGFDLATLKFSIKRKGGA